MAVSHASLDRAGVFASVACAIHCAIAPLIFIALPTLGGLWAHPVSHLSIAAFVLPVAAFALRNGFRTHGRKWVVALGTFGILFVLAGAVLPYLTVPAHAEDFACECCPSFVVDEATGTESLHVPPATIVTLIGGIALVVAHTANLRCCSAHGQVAGAAVG